MQDSPPLDGGGTFKISSKSFFQVYTVHALLRSNLVPCIFVLLPNKAQAAYCEMWTRTKGLKPGLTRRSIQTDFELASRNAINEVLPEVQLFCCFFHLDKSLWRKTMEER